MPKALLSEADRKAAWNRCREWQAKAKNLPHQESKTHHDHDLKKINNHDHDLRKPEKQPPRKGEGQPDSPKLDGKVVFRLVNQDPDFKQATTWGLWPQALYNACMKYGVDRVRSAIHTVRDYTGVKNRAAYCMTVIKNGTGPK
jgi:hypothetical protein